MIDFNPPPTPSSLCPKAYLKKLAAHSDWLIIATDNDREGENIGFEIINICREGWRGAETAESDSATLRPQSIGVWS